MSTTLTIHTRIQNAIKADVPLLLEGPTGSGKTHTIQELASAMKKTLHVINVSGELTVDLILGQQTLKTDPSSKSTTVTWVDGVLTAAMRNGDWVLFDEMNTALPEVLTVINGVLDDQRAVTLPNTMNERVRAHKDFRFVGTQNPANGDYAGTGRLNQALLNRMVRVEFGYMTPETEAEALDRHASKTGKTTLRVLADVADYTRQRLSEFDENPVSTRDLVKIIRLKEAGGMTLKDALHMVLTDKYTDTQYNRLYDRFNSIMREYRVVTGQDPDKVDPIEWIREKHNDIEKRESALREEKNNLQDVVRKELLRELLERPAGTNPWKGE